MRSQGERGEWYLTWAFLLVAACDPKPGAVQVAPPAPSAVRSAEPMADRCSTWPLPAGCVQSLRTTDDMMCAVVPGRGFCWGPGNADAPSNVVVIEEADLAARVADDDASARDEEGVKPCRWDEDGRRLRCPGASLEATPSAGLTPAPPIEEVGAGADHACLRTHGEVWCFGRAHRRRGSRATLSSESPNRVDVGAPIDDLAVHAGTTCALAKGEVFCWGDGAFFPPGTLPHVDRRYTDAVAVGRLSCLLDDGGGLHCATRQFDDQPDLEHVAQIVPVTATEDGYEVCARTKPGAVWCFPDNGDAPKRRPFLEPATELTELHPCAVTTDHRLRCRERGDVAATEYDALGRVVSTGRAVLAPCVLRETGTIACWGQLGMRYQPGQMPGIYVPVQEASDTPQTIRAPAKMVELSGACARSDDGRVWRLSLWNQPANATDHLRMQWKTAPEAIDAVALDGCHATRADGSHFVLEIPSVEDIDVAHIVPLPEVREGMPDPKRDTTSRVLSAHRCVLRPDRRVRCSTNVPGAQDFSVDPLHRSTLPRRVIPR